MRRHRDNQYFAVRGSIHNAERKASHQDASGALEGRCTTKRMPSRSLNRSFYCSLEANANAFSGVGVVGDLPQ